MSNDEWGDWGQCAYRRPDGKPHAAEKHMSGTPICWPCWNWVKLNGPAARHWLRVGGEFLSNVDMYDLTTFLPQAFGGDEEAGPQMLKMVKTLRDYCEAQAEVR